MARRVRDASLESRTARDKRAPRGKPYYRSIGRGLHLGYRKGKNAGRWVARIYRGSQNYAVETLGTADDAHDADGIEILNFWQAQERARQRQGELDQGPDEPAGPYTVTDAVTDYLEHLEGRASHYDVKRRLNAYVLPELGDKELGRLTAAESPSGIRGASRRDACPSRADSGQSSSWSDGDRINPICDGLNLGGP